MSKTPPFARLIIAPSHSSLPSSLYFRVSPLKIFCDTASLSLFLFQTHNMKKFIIGVVTVAGVGC